MVSISDSHGPHISALADVFYFMCLSMQWLAHSASFNKTTAHSKMPPISAAVISVNDPHSCQILNNTRHDVGLWTRRVNKQSIILINSTRPDTHRCSRERAHEPWVFPISVARISFLCCSFKPVKLEWTNELQKVIAEPNQDVCVSTRCTPIITSHHEKNKKLEHKWGVGRLRPSPLLF